MPKLRDAFDGPIGGYGHLGYDSNPDYGKSPEEPYFRIEERHYTGERYAEFGREWKSMGGQIIGGCCATAPRHIEALRPMVLG